jgi:PAS domain S-box-containing protein
VIDANSIPQNSDAPADHLQQICSATTAAIVFSDREYRFEHLNRRARLNDREAEFFGLRADQIMGRPITEIAPMEGLRSLLEQVLRGEAISDFLIEGELAIEPGKVRSWMVDAFPLYSSDASVETISAAWLDITKQKAAEEALIDSEKVAVRFEERTKIARDLHDTLLQTIQASKLIVDHTLDTVEEATTNGNLKQVSEWLDRALSEGRAVLDYLRISDAEGKDFAVALQDAFKDCKTDKNIRLEMSVSGGSREMRFYAREGAYRIGCEAIRNACVHSHGDQIRVEIYYAPDVLRLSVLDKENRHLSRPCGWTTLS